MELIKVNKFPGSVTVNLDKVFDGVEFGENMSTETAELFSTVGKFSVRLKGKYRITVQGKVETTSMVDSITIAEDVVISSMGINPKFRNGIIRIEKV